MDDTALLALLKKDLQRTGDIPGDETYLPYRKGEYLLMFFLKFQIDNQ